MGGSPAKERQRLHSPIHRPQEASGEVDGRPPDDRLRYAPCPMTLQGKVAVVTGSSRGAGRGIALALGSAGATVYVTGRTVRGGPKPVDGASGTVDDTADEVIARGGRGIPVK